MLSPMVFSIDMVLPLQHFESSAATMRHGDTRVQMGT